MIFDPSDPEYQTIVEEIQSLGVPWWLGDVHILNLIVEHVDAVDGSRLRDSGLLRNIALKGTCLEGHVGMSMAIIDGLDITEDSAAKVLRMALNRWFERQLEKVAVL